MSLQQFFSILLARKRIIFAIFAVVVVTTSVVSFLLPKQYSASATVLVDVKSPDPVLGGFVQALAMPGYMATQNDIIMSERVARRVVKTLGFEKSPELVAAWQKRTEGQGSVEGFYASMLSKNLDVKPSRESNVITIQFTGNNPQYAAEIANAFAQAYIDTSVELSVEPARQYTEWFVESSKQARDRLSKAQAALSAFQRDNRIVSVDERLDVENNRLNELSTQLTILEAQSSEAKSRQNEAKTGTESNPDIINNVAVQNLRSAITMAEAKLEQSSKELGRNHPQILQQVAELDSLRTKLKAEMANVARSLGVNTQVSKQKVSETRDALAAQKNRVLELKKQRDTISVLVKDVETAQREYDAINQRLSQTSLESQKQLTNIAILTRATAPIDSSSPRIMLNILLSVFLGTLLGVGVALLMELMDRRIRSEKDLLELGIPVLGILTNNTTLPSRWRFWHRRKEAASNHLGKLQHATVAR